jgi:phenylpropionate dioxygenase-like ring-hydroxylating dioxygenase large terminal subunit
MGEKLVFWRDEKGRVSCLRDKCPHRGVALSLGQVLDGHLECPFHGFQYDASGRCALIPANGRDAAVPKVFQVHHYPTYEAHGFIWVWWGQEPPADLQPPRFFDDIDDTFTYRTIYDPWDTHYSRVIENQLDVAHVPFLHYNTIGRGNRTLVDGPGLQWVDKDLFYIYPYNRLDDGTPPRRPSEVPTPDPTREYKLEFLFPNLWQNYIQADMRVVGAFVPVDEDHTLFYLRYCQRFVELPLLRELITWLALPYNRYIAHQDRRVVVTHQPSPSGLRIGEKLIQADQPIVAYRRRREALLEAARQPPSQS